MAELPKQDTAKHAETVKSAIWELKIESRQERHLVKAELSCTKRGEVSGGIRVICTIRKKDFWQN